MRLTRIIMAFFLICHVLIVSGQDMNPGMEVAEPERLQYFKDNKFGMFIHFGVYSVYEGWYDGHPSEGMPEWILKKENIPVEEYKAAAREFNPVNFDAEKIVSTARKAGMRWIIFTAKHHDCFAMFDSKVTDWDIVYATKYGRDIFKELSDECHRQGIKLGCQYTIGRNWMDPVIGDNNYPYEGEDKIYWDNYYEKVIMDQIREILTNYGEIGMMWFDSPIADLSEEIVNYVHSFQPGCVVNGRVGGDKGDFDSTYDSTIKPVPSSSFWEYCSTW